ncbi:MAG: hypothetical protein ACRDV9_14530 [Acidimicrobiia bacterium]
MLTALVALAVVLGFWVVLPDRAGAAVNCATVAATSVVDSDGDGFTDFQECNGITLADGSPVPSCVPTPTAPRESCLHPDSKDLFIIYAPATSGSLLPAGFNPFRPLTAYGVNFTGLAALGVTAHQITPAQAAADRTVTSGSPQKALRNAESLDTNGAILGNCQWGNPNGLDGCVIYTQRIRSFIASTCGTNAIVLPGAGGAASTIDQVFLAYVVHTFLHETGHTTGGMTATYNSSYGGYHYKCGAGTMMEQCVTYSAKGGKCSFNISGGWNTLDPPTVKLK